MARLVLLKDALLKAANDEIKNAKRESWEDEPTLISNMQIYHYHNDHLGTPNELTSQNGEVVWLADYQAWGNTAQVVWREEKLEQLQVSKEHLQPLRFQGQYYDEETGLHYNRFRYFDPDLGMFISRDPIGLMGGLNTFQYAPNPTGWIDPFGLSCIYFGKNRDEKRKKHFQQMRQEADRLDIEMPRKFKDAGTEQAQRQLVEKIMSEGETKVQKYMTIEGASWTKLGDSIVIRDSADNFVTYLRKSQGGAADFWNGGHL